MIFFNYLWFFFYQHQVGVFLLKSKRRQIFSVLQDSSDYSGFSDLIVDSIFSIDSVSFSKHLETFQLQQQQLF